MAHHITTNHWTGRFIFFGAAQSLLYRSPAALLASASWFASAERASSGGPGTGVSVRRSCRFVAHVGSPRFHGSRGDWIQDGSLPTFRNSLTSQASMVSVLFVVVVAIAGDATRRYRDEAGGRA